MENIADYHQQFPDDRKELLDNIYKMIKEVIPDAEESLSYGMPCFKMIKPIVYYAMGKNHLGFYPTPGPIEKYQKELKHFKTSKGAVQLPLNQPLPKELIQKMVLSRLEEIK